MNNVDDKILNQTLDSVQVELSSARLQRVRHSILLQIQSRPSFFLRSQPAFLLATGLLGLVLGAAVPLLGNSGPTSYLDYTPQNFLEGDYG